MLLPLPVNQLNPNSFRWDERLAVVVVRAIDCRMDERRSMMRGSVERWLVGWLDWSSGGMSTKKEDDVFVVELYFLFSLTRGEG